MSDSVRPHRWQPTRLPRPWDSPGKNTGVGCHFLLQCMKVRSESEVTESCPTLSDPMDYSLPGSSVHGSFQARLLEWGAIAFSTEPPEEPSNQMLCVANPLAFFLSQSSAQEPRATTLQLATLRQSIFLTKPGSLHSQPSSFLSPELSS